MALFPRRGEPRHAEVETTPLDALGVDSITYPSQTFFSLSVNIPTGAAADITEQTPTGPNVASYVGPLVVNYSDPQRIDIDTEITVTSTTGLVYVQRFYSP